MQATVATITGNCTSIFIFCSLCRNLILPRWPRLMSALEKLRSVRLAMELVKVANRFRRSVKPFLR